MKIKISAQLERMKQTLPHAVAWVKEKFFSEPRSLEEIQEILEVVFSKEENTIINEAVKSHPIVQAIIEVNGLNKEATERAVSIALSSNGFSTIGEIANKTLKFFDSIEELHLFIDNLLNKQIFISCGGESLRLHNAIKLTDEQQLLIQFRHSNMPMVCKPNKVCNSRHKAYRKIHKGSFSSGADPVDEAPWDFARCQNSMKYTIQYGLWDDYLWNHPYFPSRTEEDSDATYQKKINLALNRHQKIFFWMLLFKELGIKYLYIPIFFDGRYRSYTRGYLFNPQGTDFDKALLGIEEYILNPEGYIWLLRAVATAHASKYRGIALDKQSFRARSDWAKEYIVPLLSLSREDMLVEATKLAETADSPCCFMGLVIASWEAHKSLKQGQAPKLSTITPWDATSSGLQILSLLTNDVVMMLLSNVIKEDNEEAVVNTYTKLYEGLITVGLPESFTRTQVKEHAFIPGMYGSQREPRKLFGEEHLHTFNKFMNQFQSWNFVQNFNKGMWDRSSSSYSFWMPDASKIEITNWEVESIPMEWNGIQYAIHHWVDKCAEHSSELAPNVTHAMDALVTREIVRRMTIIPKRAKYIKALYMDESRWTRKESPSRDLMKQLLNLAEEHKFYSARIITEITPDNIDLVPEHVLQKFADECSWLSTQLVLIHDSFGINPNRSAELMMQYRFVLRDIYTSRYLERVAEYLMKLPAFSCEDKEVKPEIVQHILNSVFALS